MSCEPLIVPGDPVPWERAGAKIMGKPPRQWIKFYSPKQTQEQEAKIGAAWQAECSGPPREGALSVILTFVFARPSGHFGTGRNAALVKPHFLGVRPGGRGNRNGDGQRTGGDLDNLAKLVCDALNGIAYEDDGQIALLTATKLYVDQARVAAPQTRILVASLYDDGNEGRLL